MDDAKKSFAAKYWRHKISKVSVDALLQGVELMPLCRRTYKVTATNDMQLKQLEKLFQAKLNKSVGQSSIIRGLIQLAATNMKVREQLVQLIAQEKIHWGRPKSKPERNTPS